MKSFLGRFRRKEDEEAAPNTSPQTVTGESSESASGEKTLRRTGISVKPAMDSGAPGVVQVPPALRDEDTLRLELGDFLHRIPSQLLKSGTPDVHTEICFDLTDVSDRILRGETSIPLSEIYAQAPQIFGSEIREEDGISIRFPWQKVLKLINETTPGRVPSSALNVAAAESLAYKLKTRNVSRNIPTGHGPGGLASRESPLGKAGSKLAQKPVTWFTRPTAASPTAVTVRAPEPVQPVPAPLQEPAIPEQVAIPATREEQAVQDSTVLIDTVREEYERDLQKERAKWEAELVTIREDYEHQIEELCTEVARLRSALSPEANGTVAE